MADFKIIDCASMEPVRNVVCQFMFKGFEISLSTWTGARYGLVAVYKDESFQADFDTAEEAIKYVLENQAEA